MNITYSLSDGYGDHSLAELLNWETSKIDDSVDSLTASRQIERLQVAAGYASTYLGDRASASIRVWEVVALDSHAVADCVAPDLDDNAKAGIARTMANLVARARMFAFAS
ncbi:MAG: hypothetical protein WBY53_19865 [Acidobacteriaceae bacterium]